eukprot:gene36574-biopygen24057
MPAVTAIDASTAHRTADGWSFGFPELDRDQRAAIQAATRVSNPGCYSTGAIALIRPLVQAGIMPADYPVSINAISGYSGGGKAMIAEFEDEGGATYTTVPYRIYALGLEHKHVPEIQVRSGLLSRPLFSPSVGRYAQGMMVEVPLHLGLLGARGVARGGARYAIDRRRARFDHGQSIGQLSLAQGQRVDRRAGGGCGERIHRCRRCRAGLGAACHRARFDRMRPSIVIVKCHRHRQ